MITYLVIGLAIALASAIAVSMVQCGPYGQYRDPFEMRLESSMIATLSGVFWPLCILFWMLWLVSIAVAKACQQLKKEGEHG